MRPDAVCASAAARSAAVRSAGGPLAAVRTALWRSVCCGAVHCGTVRYVRHGPLSVAHRRVAGHLAVRVHCGVGLPTDCRAVHCGSRPAGCVVQARGPTLRRAVRPLWRPVRGVRTVVCRYGDHQRRFDRSIHRGCARPSCADRTPWRWAARHRPSSHRPPSQHDLPCSRHSVSLVAQSRSHSRADHGDHQRRVDRSIHRGCARPSCANRTPWRWAARHGPPSHRPPSQHDLPCSRHSG